MGKDKYQLSPNHYLKKIKQNTLSIKTKTKQQKKTPLSRKGTERKKELVEKPLHLKLKRK